MRLFLGVLGVAAVLGGCGDSASSMMDDAGDRPDARRRRDVGPRDAGPGDAGRGDAGRGDAGRGDADFDAAFRDARADAAMDASLCAEECDSPPPTECADETSLRRYARRGTCEAGECLYETREEACEAPAPSCTDGVAVDWTAPACADGECVSTEQRTTCAQGCCDDRCCELIPSNDEDLGRLVDNGLTVEPPDGFTFDTDDDCDGRTPIGECTAVDVFDSPDVCVCRSRRFRVGGRLNVTGSRALAIFASETLLVRGILDASGNGSASGPGAAFRYASGASGQSGGAGGSYASSGAGPSASTYGSAALIPLQGGMDGQGGCGGTLGGGGGGALQLVAGERLEVTGVINVGGGGGRGGRLSTSCNGGGGGGSGGAVLLEAPEVEVTGTVAANGGGGGAAGTDDNSGLNGGGGSGTSPGFGGDADDCGCALFGTTNGGDGGRGAFGSSSAVRGEFADSISGCIGTCVVGGGGSGGGVGRIRVNTESGCLCGGTFSPDASFGSVAVE
ncbi:MAG: hypothetical protein AAGE52_14440 [Myxococcota bacterium]